MPKYINNDLYLSNDGDFLLSSQKDFESTINDPLRSLTQGIRTRLNFRTGEWPGFGKSLGANLTDFLGKPNTKENGDLIKMRVINELTKGNFLSINDIVVDVIPIAANQVTIKLKVKTAAGVFEYNTKFSFREDYTSMNKGEI